MRAYFKNIEIPLILIFLFGIVLSCSNPDDSYTKDISITKIWDITSHDGFTDLIKFNGSYYCSYSEEYYPYIDSSESIEGIRIIRSKNGKNWESVFFIKKKGMNIDNSRISITPDRQIMIIIDGPSYPLVSFSDKKGDVFSDPEPVNIDKTINSDKERLCKVTWFRGTGYSLFYESDKKKDNISLLKTIDGKNFEKVVKLKVDGLFDESTLRFDQKGIMYAIINNTEKEKRAIVGISNWPYIKWSYRKVRDVPENFNYTIINKNIIMVGTGLSDPEMHTGILIFDKKDITKEIIKIPFFKDVCFPGILKEPGKLVFTCCSMQDGNPAIYMVKVPVNIIKSNIN